MPPGRTRLSMPLGSLTAGWKPGDPLPEQHVPTPELPNPGSTLPAAAAASRAPAVATTTESQQPAASAKKPQRPVIDASFLILNPAEEEEAVEEDYSSEDYSDSD